MPSITLTLKIKYGDAIANQCRAAQLAVLPYCVLVLTYQTTSAKLNRIEIYSLL